MALWSYAMYDIIFMWVLIWVCWQVMEGAGGGLGACLLLVNTALSALKLPGIILDNTSYHIRYDSQ